MRTCAFRETKFVRSIFGNQFRRIAELVIGSANQFKVALEGIAVRFLRCG